MEVLLISDFEKHIYNTFLKTARSSANKPYRLRKDFSNLDDVAIACLKRLSAFFKNHNEIDVDEFFSAPHKLYKEDAYYDLKYFTSLKAIKAYNLLKQKNNRLEQKKPVD